MKVPKHFDEKAISLHQRFTELAIRSEQWANRIAEIVLSWREFSKTLEELTKWTWCQDLEMTSLLVIEEFAGEFSSHQTRLKVNNLFSNLSHVLHT